MATYANAISRLSEKLRDSEAWPSDSSKEGEQLYLLYNAALAVFKSVPITRLPAKESTALSNKEIQDNITEFAFPADMLYFRADWGIQKYLFDGRVFFPVQALPYQSLIIFGENSRHRHRKMFAMNRQEKLIYTMNVTEAKVVHVGKPIFPANTATDYPLSEKDNDFELAMSIVAAHVTGETIRDGAQSTFQTFLTQLYGDDNE